MVELLQTSFKGAGYSKPIEMLVAPYTGPVDALKNLVPQLSQISQRRGGTTVTLDNLLEPPKPAQAGFPNGQAWTVYFTVTRTGTSRSHCGTSYTRCRTSRSVDPWGPRGDSVHFPSKPFK